MCPQFWASGWVLLWPGGGGHWKGGWEACLSEGTGCHRHPQGAGRHHVVQTQTGLFQPGTVLMLGDAVAFLAPEIQMSPFLASVSPEPSSSVILHNNPPPPEGQSSAPT